MDDVVRDGFGALTNERGAASGGAILDRVTEPADLKALSHAELSTLCTEIRDYIVDVVSQKGGHLGASLGVVDRDKEVLRLSASPTIDSGDRLFSWHWYSNSSAPRVKPSV